MLEQETELVRSASVADMIQKRNLVMECIGRIAADATTIKEVGTSLSLLLPGVEVGAHCYGSMYSRKVPDEVRATVDVQFWHKLMQDSGAWSFLDAKRRAEWRSKVSNPHHKPDEIPAFDGPTIEATFKALHGQRGNMVIDGVDQVFKNLSWHYATNTPVAFGKKIIVSGCAGWSYTRCDQIDDLARILYVFEGKPEPDHRDTFSRKISCAGQSRIELEDEYLRVIRYKNGNAHVWFKDQEHVVQLNKIIGDIYPDCLPAARP